MNTNLLDIIKRIIAEQGKGILADPPRLRAFFMDLAKDEPRQERLAFGRCMELGSYEALKNARTPEERRQKKETLADLLHTKTGIYKDHCEGALDLLEAVMFGVTPEPGPGVKSGTPVSPKPPPPPKPETGFCTNCGEQLPAKAKFCMTCGTQTASSPLEVPPEQKTIQEAFAGFVRVDGGTFLMGTPEGGEENERPVRSVTVSGFYMSRFPVTQREWFEVMGKNPSYFKGDKLPVETVSWFDAIEYANEKSRRAGLTLAYTIKKGWFGKDVTWNRAANGYRLPTEAEWEFAARGGHGSPGNFTYSGSNNIDEVAWHEGNSAGSTQEVGSKMPNALGLYDMSGNMCEWCWDWFSPYPSVNETDPAGPAAGEDYTRVARGGSWDDTPDYARSAFRHDEFPDNRYSFLGFRVVRP